MENLAGQEVDKHGGIGQEVGKYGGGKVTGKVQYLNLNSWLWYWMQW